MAAGEETVMEVFAVAVILLLLPLLAVAVLRRRDAPSPGLDPDDPHTNAVPPPQLTSDIGSSITGQEAVDAASAPHQSAPRT